MSDERRHRADVRLAEALARNGQADTRPVYRQRLRQLRESHPAAFERALHHYDDVVLPNLAGDADPIDTWIAYGAWLADLTAVGRLMSIQVGGRAVPFSSPYAPGQLVLHLPEDGQLPALALMFPAAPSSAQQAAYDLLVAGRVSLA
jgi:hypothetical protein